MFGQNRQQLRQFYHDVWSKVQSRQPLSALENMVAEVIDQHPEYHTLLSQKSHHDQEFFVENGQTNPYLHMGLHISLHEQISTDRPSGMQVLYQQLLQQTGNAHYTEHLMMDCLAESLWQTQSTGIAPSEQSYLQSLQKLINS